MQHKLYKTHRKRTYYELRRVSTITFSVAFLCLAILVPLTLNVGAIVSPSVSSTLTELPSSSETSSQPTNDSENVYEDVIPTIRRTR